MLFALAIVPDLDLLFEPLLQHRGPTHSAIIGLALALPFIFKYGKTALPYFLAFISHPLIGDFFSGGAQILWPLSDEMYGFKNIETSGTTSAVIETILFLIFIGVFIKTGDFQGLLRTKKHKIFLIIPLGATVGPMIFLLRGTAYGLPQLLIVPSLVLASIFIYALLADLRKDRNHK